MTLSYYSSDLSQFRLATKICQSKLILLFNLILHDDY
jgi:hypothetical protein